MNARQTPLATRKCPGALDMAFFLLASAFTSMGNNTQQSNKFLQNQGTGNRPQVTGKSKPRSKALAANKRELKAKAKPITELRKRIKKENKTKIRISHRFPQIVADQKPGNR